MPTANDRADQIGDLLALTLPHARYYAVEVVILSFVDIILQFIINITISPEDAVKGLRFRQTRPDQEKRPVSKTPSLRNNSYRTLHAYAGVHLRSDS